MTVPNDPAASETPATPDAGLPGKQGYDPHGVEERWYRFWEEQGLFHADETSTGSPVLHRHPAPQRDRLACTWGMPSTTPCRTSSSAGTGCGGTTRSGCRARITPGSRRRTWWSGSSGRRAHAGSDWAARPSSSESGSGSASPGGTIIRQLKTLGASCDWERERFTLDPGLSNAVKEVFCQLYDAGLIYRGDYIINWCPRCQTALSDLEVEYQERDGKLWHIRYPLVVGRRRGGGGHDAARDHAGGHRRGGPSRGRAVTGRWWDRRCSCRS